jgi:2-(1,2-epoxy-1,2-dihydrophenyl)acetyl-CoA isomerase
MPYDVLEFDVRDGVAHVTLNRPRAGNSINLEMGRELLHAALRCDEDPGVRAVVLAGSGNSFCFGGDLKEFSERGEDLPHLHAAISRLARMDPPVVAAVHGAAAGGGFSLAISCDLVLAAESSRFAMAYSKAGLTPDGSSTYHLPRLVGLRRAMELALTGRELSAQEAFEWGIVNRVVPDEVLSEEATGLAERLATGPTRALGVSKQLLHGGWTETLETQMEHETRAIADISRTADAREGIAAFTQKRAASFEGN